MDVSETTIKQADLGQLDWELGPAMLAFEV